MTRGRTPFIQDAFNKFAQSHDLSKHVAMFSYEQIYDTYITWADMKNEKAISKPSFMKLIKTIKASNESSGTSLSDQFDALYRYINIMKRGIINSLYVYGAPGIGKSEEVKTALIKEKARYKIFSGAVKGAHELVKILYENRKDTIIVFDDFDSIMKNRTQINLMQIALQDHPQRTITWVDGTKRAKKDKIPSSFEFTSAVIVISNKKKIDPAIRSRSIPVRFDDDKEQNLEWIKKNFKTFLPLLSMKDKHVVYDFFKRNIHKFDRVDYRIFKFAIATMLMYEKQEKWKKIIINSGKI